MITLKKHMTGTLHKVVSGWVVRWSDLHTFSQGSIMMDTPIHPDDNDGSFVLREGKYVEFNLITTDYCEKDFHPITSYAKLRG